MRLTPPNDTPPLSAKPSATLPATTAALFSLILTATAQNIQLSELLVSNNTSLRDEDGRRADWIEIHNPSPAAINLAGYHLSDDPGDPTKWSFPPRPLDADGYLIVFATGLDRSSDPSQPLHTNFKLGPGDGSLTLLAPDGTRSRITFPPAQFADISFGFSGAPSESASPPDHLQSLTPGAPNSPLLQTGPLIASVTRTPTTPIVSAIPIDATVTPRLHPIETVSLYYRTMFGPEIELPMQPVDGHFQAAIPTADVQPGQMLRWRVVARDTSGNQTTHPPFPTRARRNADQYYGTVRHDPGLTSPLPLLHLFTTRPGQAEQVSGTRASIFFNNRFYDNVFIRKRGGAAALWAKTSFKIEFNDGNPFLLAPGASPVDEFNLNSTYTDKSYLRARLAAEFGNRIGLPSPETLHFRVHQNGTFHSVALFVEQPDRDFLERHGLDPDGALYKANSGSTYNTTSSFEKKTRQHEDNADLQALLDALATPGASRDRYLYDHIDLPAQINYMAAVCITQNIDASDKNHYLYRDTNGTREWRMLPWDLDLTFGPDALNTDTIVFAAGADSAYASHPFIGTRPHVLVVDKYNLLLEAIIAADGPRQMLLRRIRTLADQFLAAGYFQDRIDQLIPLIADDVRQDRAHWGSRAHFSGSNAPFETVAARIVDEYLAPKVGYLLQTHADPDNPDAVGMPLPQPAKPTLTINALQTTATSGNRPGQFAELHNPNPFAVDLTDWRVRGSIAHKFKPGTVIPAASSLFLSPDPSAFRSRTTPPNGDQGHFVQCIDAGALPDAGALIQLFNPAGDLVLEHTDPGQPSDLQRFLRINEIYYNPPGQSEDAEFIELANTSTEVPLDLSALSFTEGITYSFPNNTTVDPGEIILLVADPAGFTAAHGPGLPVVGTYTGRLSNGGEQIELTDPSGSPILFLDYDDDWYKITDGAGYSLVPSDPTSRTHAFGQIDQWAPALPSPGKATVSFSYDYQAWLAHQFAHRPIESPDPADDTDQDNLTNWFEFAFAQDMDAPSHPDVATVSLTAVGDRSLPAMQYPRPAHPTGVVYTYHWSDAAGGSNELVGGTETITPGATPHTETVTFTPDHTLPPFDAPATNLVLSIRATQSAPP